MVLGSRLARRAVPFPPDILGPTARERANPNFDLARRPTRALQDGYTVLHYAVGKGHYDVAKQLINARADVTKGDQYVSHARQSHSGPFRYL